MGTISLLDCTVRDGGYINNWHFGKKAIEAIHNKVVESGVEFYEVGFLRNCVYDEDYALYPTLDTMSSIIASKGESTRYIGMLDVSSPVDRSVIIPYDGSSLDAIRVIFKKNRQDEGLEWCKYIKSQGYQVYVQLVATDTYSDEELIETVRTFSAIHPDGIYIVDTMGSIRKSEFLHMVKLMDEIMPEEISLGYHSHNNLQHAYGNAQAFVELGLRRDIIIDACVYGMGRGAGNLNLELFAQYLNEKNSKNYKIEPLLEIMDDYLMDIYREHFWGYSLAYYLTGTYGCHPNYANYFLGKNSLTFKGYSDIFRMMSPEDKLNYSAEKAEFYFQNYQSHSCDDSLAIESLKQLFGTKPILMIATGMSVIEERDIIDQFIEDRDPIVITLNHINNSFCKDSYAFFSNEKRYHMSDGSLANIILSSNITDRQDGALLINYMAYASSNPLLSSNAAIVCLNLLKRIGCDHIYIAGMDGYTSVDSRQNFIDKDISRETNISISERNNAIMSELKNIEQEMQIDFITKTIYS